LVRGWPVISVDTKKKELVGNYGNSGQEWQPAGQPVEVDVHDFPDPDTPKAVPRGVYDEQHNEGWVTVGCSHLRDPNRMTNSGTSFDVEMGVARKDRTHGQTLTTR